MTPVFWRYLQIRSGIFLSTLLAAVLIFASPSSIHAQAPSSADSLAKYTVAAFKAPTIEFANLNATGMAGFNSVQAREQAPATQPAASTSDALTWHGITVYGTYDVGIGWVSHGLPQSPYNYEGSSLVNRNAAGSRFLVEPDNLSQTGLGIRGREEFAHNWFVVFNASTGINPQSGQLSNASLTDIKDNGLPRGSYSEAIDGARAGQPFNDEYYAGVSSTYFGTLTFGRQRALGTDTMLQYDPVSGGYAFSYIGYNGTMAGGGDTENTRWDNAVKYRLTYGKAHFGAMYKFVDGSGGCYTASSTWTGATCTAENPHNNAYGFNLGGEIHKFSSDIVYQHYNQAISVVNPLLGPASLTQPYQSTTDSINTNPIAGTNLIDPSNTVYGIVTDNNAVMATAKYTLDPFKFYAGYEYIWQNNPKNPLGVGATDQGGYLMSGVEDNNLDNEKLLQIWGRASSTPTAPKPTSLYPGTSSGRTTSALRQPARSQPASAAPAPARSTRARSTPIIASPRISTASPVLLIPS